MLVVDEVAERVPDGALVEQAGRELVEERLERVVVVPVDEHDVGGGVLQLLRSADPGESAAEDDDARACVGCHSQSLPVRLGKAASSASFTRQASPAPDERAREACL